MTTKAKANPMQTIKLLVLLNSLLILTVVFLLFFNKAAPAATHFAVSEPLPQDAAMGPTTSTTAQSITPVATNQADELQQLPYVSRRGLEKQSAVQVASYKRQPRVQARSSR